MSNTSLSRSLKTGSLLLAAALTTSLSAFAGDTADTSKESHTDIITKPATDPRFYVDLAAGGEFDMHATKFISNGSAQFGTFGVSDLQAKIQSRDFTESHDVAVINGRVEIGYKVLPYLSLFTGFTYSHSNGDDSLRLGRVTDVGPGAFGAFGVAGGRYDLYADVERYQAFAGMAGAKLRMPRTILDLIHAPKAITPYASFSAGGKYLDSQSVRFYSGGSAGVPVGALVNTGRVQLYNDSWVFTGEFNLGYDLQLTRNFGITFENGYGYDTKPERSTLPGVIHGTNDSGDRFYSTVSLGAKLTF